MFSQVVILVQNGGYSVRGVLIITDKHEEVAEAILEELNRGATYLKGQGAYSGKEKNVLYVALNPTDVRLLKEMMEKLDPDAFISILNVEEIISPDFIVSKRERKLAYR